VTKSVEGFRATSLKEAHEQVRSKRFMDTFKTSSKDGGLEQIIGDVDSLIDQLMEKDVIAGLNSIKVHDNYTFQHSIDVSIMVFCWRGKSDGTKND
jgi:HD-GYP domain-containing protein (c-di-GMP phosphodiesterase class II)